jgi:hypothetical protein
LQNHVNSIFTIQLKSEFGVYRQQFYLFAVDLPAIAVNFASFLPGTLLSGGVVKGWIVFSGKAKMRAEAQFTRSK